MLTELCRECRNWFTTDSDKHSGDFTISDGGITPFDFVLSGQYSVSYTHLTLPTIA